MQTKNTERKEDNVSHRRCRTLRRQATEVSVPGSGGRTLRRQASVPGSGGRRADGECASSGQGLELFRPRE